jgi:enoyl-CoA hydratase/3-hydroxyacyl-CoA dehydrogenase
MQELTPNTVDSVTVVGAGTMGHGIAQTVATAGYDVTLVDIDDDVLVKALEKIKHSLQRLEDDPEVILDRISTTTEQDIGLQGADVMIEAVPESVELKEQVFSAADDVLPPHAVLATNTSTLPVSEMAAVTDRPEQVVGLHFSSPVPLMPIVEVIRGIETSEAVFAFGEAFSEAIGKEPVLVEKDVPGFLLNRINYNFWSEGLRRLDNDEYDLEAIDAAIRRLDFPMGPFEVLDFAGVDVFYMVCQSMQSRGVPVEISDLHEELFEAGDHGMKAGKGFYNYPAPGEYARVDIPRERRYEYDPYEMIASAVNAAAWLLENDVTTREDLDRAMEIGMSWPQGPLEIADEYGIDRIVETLERLHAESGWEQYEPHPMLLEMVEQEKLGVKSGEGFYLYDNDRETFGPVTYEREENLAYITLSRPAVGNVLNEATWRGLQDAFARAAETEAVLATILRADGDVFSLGVDVGELKSRSPDEVSAFVADVVRPGVDAIRTHPKPTVALVEGSAADMGCDLVLLTDMAVASTDSDFSQPAATRGIIPPMWIAHGAQSVGKKKVLELAMTGDSLPASEAAEAGLVNYAVSPTQASDVARELAKTTSAAAPHALEAIGRSWRATEMGGADEWAESCWREFEGLLDTEATHHGLSCYLNDQTPRWGSPE